MVSPMGKPPMLGGGPKSERPERCRQKADFVRLSTVFHRKSGFATVKGRVWSKGAAVSLFRVSRRRNFFWA